MKKLAVKEVEILHSLWMTSQGFKKEIEEVRKSREIPKEGFSDKNSAFEWLLVSPQRYFNLITISTNIIEKYKLPRNLEMLVAEYIVTNAEKKLIDMDYANTPAYIVPEKEKNMRYITEEKRLQENKTPYVKILVYPHANSKTLVQFIKKHYGTKIKPQIEAHTGLQKRIRTTTQKKRDRAIITAWKEDTGKEKQEMKQTKENRIATKLKTTPETIRKTLQKTRKGSPIK